LAFTNAQSALEALKPLDVIRVAGVDFSETVLEFKANRLGEKLTQSIPEILCWCEDNNFILVTNNRTSMPVHLADHIVVNRHVPGIFILNPNLSIGENIEELIIVALASEDDEYQDRIVYLPLP
jgi:hypothetical protein